VETDIPVEVPAVGAPMVTPPKVMVMAPLMAVLPTVNTTDVAPVGALVLTVLGAMMEGVTPGAKKPEG